MTADRTVRRRRSWQAITIAILVVGYSGYYLCRSNLPVALPLILQDMASRGVPTDLVRIRFGTIAPLAFSPMPLENSPPPDHFRSSQPHGWQTAAFRRLDGLAS